MCKLFMIALSMTWINKQYELIIYYIRIKIKQNLEEKSKRKDRLTALSCCLEAVCVN